MVLKALKMNTKKKILSFTIAHSLILVDKYINSATNQAILQFLSIFDNLKNERKKRQQQYLQLPKVIITTTAVTFSEIIFTNKKFSV